MTSERRKQSSRANGAKSRGPVTPEGKARSSHNSYRHGLLSNDLVLDQENPQSLLELLTALELAFAPADEFELSCVETMAAARWRVLRIWGMETAGFQQEIDNRPGLALYPRYLRTPRKFEYLLFRGRLLIGVRRVAHRRLDSNRSCEALAAGVPTQRVGPRNDL